MLTVFHRSERAKYREVEEFTEREARAVCLGLQEFCKPLLADLEPVTNYPAFSVRAENTLRRCGIKTFGELSTWRKTLPGAGRKTFEEFRVALESYGLPLPEQVTQCLKKKGVL